MDCRLPILNCHFQNPAAARANWQLAIGNWQSRRGFSFAEVMFAVVILGIGFIMVAAVFPVAIKQGQATAEESFSAAVARNGAGFASQAGLRSRLMGNAVPQQDIPVLFPTDLMLEATGSAPAAPPRSYALVEPGNMPEIVAPGAYSSRGKLLALGDFRVFDESPAWPLHFTQLRELSGDTIVPADPRFAWVVMYRRDRNYVADGRPLDPNSGLPTLVPPNNEVAISSQDYVRIDDAGVAQLVIFGVQVRNRTQFDQLDLPETDRRSGNKSIKQFNLQPRPVAVKVRQEAANSSNYVLEVGSIRNLAGGDHPLGGFPTGAAYNNIYDAAPNALTEGCFVVISDDRIIRDNNASALSAKVAGRMNGRIFRVGAQRTDIAPSFNNGTVWDLFPGYEFTPDAGGDGVFNPVATPIDQRDDILGIGVDFNNGSVTLNGTQYFSNVRVEGTTPANTGAIAFIMGRGLTENYMRSTAANAVPEFEGLPMDVSVYTTVIKVK